MDKRIIVHFLYDTFIIIIIIILINYLLARLIKFLFILLQSYKTIVLQFLDVKCSTLIK